jgi:hypothetical protein
MENDQKGNQKAGNGGQSQGRKHAGASASALQLLQPHDMSKTVESAMHVFQGKHEKLPELLHDVGKLVLQGARRMSTTQLVLTVGAVTIGAVLVAKYVSEHELEFEE